MRILIAIPSMDQVPAQFAASLAMLRKTEETAVAFEISSLIYTARNTLALKAIEHKADYILWLDSDMQFAPDTLEKLYADYKADKGDIISGLYFRRVAPFSPVLFDWLEMTAEGCFHTEPKTIPDDIFEVQGIGFGCVFMDIGVIIDVFNKFGTAFGPINGVGEDLSFCWRARQCGYKIVCDPSIQLGHVAHTVVDREFWETFNENKEGK